MFYHISCNNLDEMFLSLIFYIFHYLLSKLLNSNYMFYLYVSHTALKSNKVKNYIVNQLGFFPLKKYLGMSFSFQ